MVATIGTIRVMVMGPTGAAGSEIVRQCTEDPRIATVLAVSRRALDVSDPKVAVAILEDFADFSPLADRFRDVDACFCALGVSSVTVRDPALYRRITFDYVLAGARVLARENPGARFCFVSAREADQDSRRMHVRVKGETEDALRGLLGDRLTVFRPGYIHPVRPRPTPGWQDTLFGPFVFLRPLLPGFVTDTVELARAVIHAGLFGSESPVLDNRRIGETAARYDEARALT